MAENDVNSEKSITADNEPAAKKFSIRQPFESAPKYHHNRPPLLTNDNIN